MPNKILLQIGIGGLIGSFFAFSPMAIAQSSSQIPSAATLPAASGNTPGNALELPAFPGTAPATPAAPFKPAPAAGNIVAAPPAAVTAIPTPPAPPPPIIAKPVSVAAPATNTVPPAALSPDSDIQAKNPAVIMTPLHLGSTSLLFPQNDIDVIRQLMELYDNISTAQKQTAAGHSVNDDLNSLLKELTKSGAPPPVEKLLPNVYLASIVYYSPSHWSVWINDKKLVNTRNTPDNEFYVSRISRTQAELVWKPPSLLDTGEKWKERTDNGKKPLADILVDEPKGTVTLLMRPGQTFLPRSLAIAEGLIKSVPGAAAPAKP